MLTEKIIKTLQICSHANLITLRIAYYSLFQPHTECSSAICCITMGPEKSRNQRNNVKTPKLCS